MSKDRFDLEQEIMDCWSVTRDIDLFYNTQDTMTQDQQQNYLIGLVAIYEAKFQKMWDTFEHCIKIKQVQ